MLAVLAVLWYHHDASAVPGGWLGVSLFITLSGFLIADLLLAEHAGTGRIDLRAFWARRVRRLVPAAVAIARDRLLVLLRASYRRVLAASGARPPDGVLPAWSVG